MPTMIENAVALWTWPLQAAQLGSDVAETMLGAQRVVFARLPTIGTAMRDPLAADHAELGRMVSEKVAAFRVSGETMTAAGEAVRQASSANARALGRMAGGGLLWPGEWMRLAESNLAAAAALVALPAAALTPIQRTVSANDDRLGRASPPRHRRSAPAGAR